MSDQSNTGESLGRLLLWSSVALAAGLAIGACVWLPFLRSLAQVDLSRGALGLSRGQWLLIVLGNQVGLGIVGWWISRGRKRSEKSAGIRRQLLLGFGVALLAIILGVVYDESVRRFAGREAPTIGPWGAIKELDLPLAVAVTAFSVVVTPAADELFFRAGLFGRWNNGRHPLSGLLISALAFACSRLDAVNFAAYVGLGCLLCLVYRMTSSMVVVYTAHATLNAAMFACLFLGYQ